MPNTAPVVYAGPNQTGDINEVIRLNAATVTDDGLPAPPATVTYAWTVTSGPGTPTWESQTTLQPWVTFPLAGTYLLRLTASDSDLSAYDECQITISARVVQGASICGTRAHFTWVETNYQVMD